MSEKQEIGNGAKMREAVEQMEVSNVKTHAIFSKFTKEALDAVNKIYDLVSKPCVVLEDVFQACQQARAILYNPPVTKTPPRNCDVGTAEEQAQRFYKFCMANSSAIRGMCDSKCPCIDSGDKCHCLTKWAQMPYEEGDAK